jgi:tetratricopeptide (TPR) repeat protein
VKKPFEKSCDRSPDTSPDRSVILFCVALAATSCAPTYANGYQETLARGLAAENAGRYEEAAEDFRKAAELGDRYKDRDEARLLQAHAYERLNRLDDAEKTYAAIVKEGGGRYQAVRAEFARARVETMRHGSDKGDAFMIAAVKNHPTSGLARHAMMRMLDPIEENKGPDAALAWLKGFEPAAKGNDLEEEVSYEEGLVLFRAGRYKEARDVFIAQARAHPYPHGSLTDDAYYQASLLAEELGNVDQAISLLIEMMKPTEAAYAGSSYERPRFPEAQFRIATIVRDKVHDRERAKREFRKACSEHSASRFCDDALWDEARLEREDHEDDKACQAMHRLIESRPDSRYVACAHALCESIAENPKCHDYILRDLRGEAPPPDAAPDEDAPPPKLMPAPLPN